MNQNCSCPQKRILSGCFYGVLVLGLLFSEFAKPLDDNLEAALMRLQTWMVQQEKGPSTLYKDSSRISSDLQIVQNNFSDSRVAKFIKKENALVRLTHVCPVVCKKLVTVGLSSSDKGIREPAQNLLRIMTRPNTKEISDPNSLFNVTAKVYSQYVENYGTKNMTVGSPGLVSGIKEQYSDRLFSGDPSSVNLKNAQALLQMRARGFAELSKLTGNKPKKEKDFVLAWFVNANPLASRRDYLAELERLGVNPKEIAAATDARVRNLARKAACQYWTHPKKQNDHSVFVEFRKAIQPSYPSEGLLTLADFKKSMENFSFDEYALQKISSRWPALVSAFSARAAQDPMVKIEFLEFINLATGFCSAKVAQAKSTSRCLKTCDPTSCDFWDDLKTNSELFLNEAREHSEYVSSLKPSKVQISEYEANLKDQEKKIVDVRARIVEAKVRGASEKELVDLGATLNRLEAPGSVSAIALEDEEVDACVSKGKANGSPEFSDLGFGTESSVGGNK